MSKKILFSLLLFSLILSSCSSSKIDLNSYSHPDFLNKRYESLAVYFNNSNLEFRTNLESSLVEELNDEDVKATEGSILFPPIQEWTDDYKINSLKEKGIDGFLIFELYSDTLSNKHSVKQDNLYPFKVSTKIEDSDSDYSIKYTFNIKLIDVQTNRLAWQGKFDPFYLKYINKSMNKRSTYIMLSDVIEQLEAKGHIVLD